MLLTKVGFNQYHNLRFTILDPKGLINDILNEYEIVVFNNSLGQWVRHRKHKLIPYDTFQEIDEIVFKNCVILLYKDKDLTYTEAKSKEFIEGL